MIMVLILVGNSVSLRIKENNHFRRKKIRFVTALDLDSNALNRSNNRDCFFLRAHLYLSYHGYDQFIDIKNSYG